MKPSKRIRWLYDTEQGLAPGGGLAPRQIPRSEEEIEIVLGEIAEEVEILEAEIATLKQLLQEVSEEVIWGGREGPNVHIWQMRLKERVDALLTEEEQCS